MHIYYLILHHLEKNFPRLLNLSIVDEPEKHITLEYNHNITFLIFVNENNLRLEMLFYDKQLEETVYTINELLKNIKSVTH